VEVADERGVSVEGGESWERLMKEAIANPVNASVDIPYSAVAVCRGRVIVVCN